MAKEANESKGPGRNFYLVLGALVVAGVVVLLLAGGGGGPEPVGPLSQADMDVEADSGAYAVAKGPEDAPVTVIEFADFQCSHCARFAALPAPALRRDYVETGQVRMLTYDFPLSRQTNAIPAALAARCAGEQGQYLPMHDLLYARQRDWAADESPEDKFVEYAEQVGVDIGQFNSCYSDREYLEEIIASRRFGERMGVTGTPAIYVNGHKARGYSYEAIQRIIEAELDSVGASPSASGSPGAESGGRG